MIPSISRSYYSASAAEFLRAAPDAILSELFRRHTFATDPNQRNAWQMEISHLRDIASALADSFFFLEFAIPRMGKRADAVIISGGQIFVIEYRVGDHDYRKQAIDQVLDYALDLKNFHEGSHNRIIVPILVATEAPHRELKVQAWSDGVVSPILTNRETFLPAIQVLRAKAMSSPISAEAWAASPYKPTPTIVEAAKALYQGHDVREVSRSEAGAENLSKTGSYIGEVIEQAKLQNIKVICFVTGVPGSGKTLAGLNIATERMHASAEEHAVFLSGNGPLVAVLREALAMDEVDRTRASVAFDALVAPSARLIAIGSLQKDFNLAIRITDRHYFAVTRGTLFVSDKSTLHPPSQCTHHRLQNRNRRVNNSKPKFLSYWIR